jgi:hypothetical protein
MLVPPFLSLALQAVIYRSMLNLEYSRLYILYRLTSVWLGVFSLGTAAYSLAVIFTGLQIRLGDGSSIVSLLVLFGWIADIAVNLVVAEVHFRGVVITIR